MVILNQFVINVIRLISISPYFEEKKLYNIIYKYNSYYSNYRSKDKS